MSSDSGQRDFAVEVVSKLRAAGHIALFAGGCVRDFLLGRPSKDYDVATTALPDQVRAIFGSRRTTAVGASFGVIVVLGPRTAGHVEVATFRTDGNYLDGRRPSHVDFCSPEQDAQRRDFTINGMFYDPVEERVLDYVGGTVDLEARLIRAIGDPHARVREDKLRMLRAVRFTATLDFQLDPNTAAAIREMSAELNVVSAERIAQELRRMLVDRHRRRAMELALEVQLLSVIFPELNVSQNPSTWQDTLQRLELLEQPTFEVALASLLLKFVAKSGVTAICRRLKLSNDELDRTVWLVDQQHALDDAPRLRLSELKRQLSHPYHQDLLQLMQTDRNATPSKTDAVEFCRQFLCQTPREVIAPPPLVTGDDLIALGMRPGPRFKSILESVRDAQLNLEISDRDEALAKLQSERMSG